MQINDGQELTVNKGIEYIVLVGIYLRYKWV